MATQTLSLTRDQLATFLKNFEQIKKFEQLFALADEIAPASDTQGISIQAGNADAAANEALALIVSLAQDMAINSGAADQKAVQALDTLSRIANALEMLATAPAIENNNSVVTDYIDLPEDGPHVTQARRVQWNQDDGTVDIGLYGGSVLQVGQEMMYYAKNTSGGLITNGTPVMFTGTVGSSGKLTFGLAVADGSVLADYMMGVATQDIADNEFGYVTSFGLVRGFDTTGVPYGEVWADGDLLYFDPATPGTWTNVQPQAPNIDVPVAVVVNAGSVGSGSIFVRMTIAESVARLQDVYISGIANGDLLQYDSAQQRWENVPASTLPVGTATNIAGGAAGSVPYQSAPSTTTFRAIGTADQVFRVNAGATAPEWVSPAALTKVDDTNVTLTLGGNPTNALLAAASLTLGWTGQLSVARGGSGASTAAGARTNFGATTVGSNLFTLANPSAVTYMRINADNSVSTLDAATFRTAIGAGTGNGTVTSVATGTGLTGGPITGSGTISFSTAAVGTWAATPSSANLAAAMTDETGSGSLVFATQPSFASTIGVGGATASASGAGVSFPATQSASTDPNTLDDYEEGTWTPGYAPTTGAFATITYGFATGYYRKIGDMVFCWCRLRTDSLTVGTGSGGVLLTGLPFTSNSASAARVYTAAGVGVDWIANPSGIATVASATTAEIQKTFSNSGLVVTDMNTGAAKNFLAIMFYYSVA